MPKIFISYRRDDSKAYVGRLNDRLVKAFGKQNIFTDVNEIEFGTKWRGALIEAVAKADVFLIVIGSQWLTITDSSGQRRLDDPQDPLRKYELEPALGRGTPLIIPVLVGNAKLPDVTQLPRELEPLVELQAAPLRDDPYFDADVENLIARVKANFRIRWIRSPLMIVGLVIGLFLLGAVGIRQIDTVQKAIEAEFGTAYAVSNATMNTEKATYRAGMVFPTALDTSQPTATNTDKPTASETPIPATATSDTPVPIATSVPPTLTLETVAAAVINEPTTIPTVMASKTLLLPTSTVVVKQFPCDGTITFQSEATRAYILYSQPNGIVLGTVNKGQKVKVRRKQTEKSVTWYQVADPASTGSSLGWLTANNIVLSASCPA